MKPARFREKQIIGILKMAEAAGNIRVVCQEHNITEQTLFGGVGSTAGWKWPKRRSFGTSSARTTS
jgi:hypothetical protein